MRWGWLALSVAATAACSATPGNPAAIPPPKPGTIPAWLPAYSPQQLALLEPGGEQVVVPAARTYPDPSVFQYSPDVTMSDPREAMRATKIVADLVSESPRLYTVTVGDPTLVNVVAQYGPPPKDEPDPWLLGTKDVAGRMYLIRAKVFDDARDDFEDGVEAADRGDYAEATKQFSQAVKADPDALPVRLALARAYAKSKQLDRAEAEFREVIRVDPTLATGHVGLAEVLFEKGDRFGARTSVAHALAYHPYQKDALKLVEQLVPEKAAPRPTPYTIFMEVDPTGVVRIATGPTAASRMYGGCRAIMRYEPELRAALFNAGPEDPYVLSSAEEMFCIQSAIGVYVAERAVARDDKKAPPEDEQTGALLGLAHTEGLLGFVMYEVLGRHRPEHARRAPATVHRAMMQYVQRHLLDYDPGPDMRNYSATAR